MIRKQINKIESAVAYNESKETLPNKIVEESFQTNPIPRYDLEKDLQHNFNTFQEYLECHQENYSLLEAHYKTYMATLKVHTERQAALSEKGNFEVEVEDE